MSDVKTIRRVYLNGYSYVLGEGASVVQLAEGQEIPDPTEAVILHANVTLDRAYVRGMSGNNEFLQEV